MQALTKYQKNEIATIENISTQLSQSEIINIRDKFKDFLKDKVKTNTQRSYKNAIRNKNKTGFLDILATEKAIKENISYAKPIDAIVFYIEALEEKGLKIDSIKTRLAGVSSAYAEIGILNLRQNKLIKDAMQAANNKTTDKQVETKQAKAINFDDFKFIIRSIDTNTITGKRDKAVLLLGMHCGLRRSEIANLKASDVTIKLNSSEKEILKLKLRNTKTDKTRKGQIVNIQKASNAHYCPIEAVKVWLDTRKDFDCENLFTRVHRHDTIINKPLSSEAINRLVKKYLGSNFSGHSLRVSLVCHLAKKQMTAQQISTITRHKDTRMITHYAQQTQEENNTLEID